MSPEPIGEDALRGILARAREDRRPSPAEALTLAECNDLKALTQTAAALRDAGHGDLVSYSRKVFIPLTKLCRDVCHYCTFAQPPRPGTAPYLLPEEVLAIARAGRAAGCREALFTVGDKPELRWRAARGQLDALGYPDTLAYVGAMAQLVFEQTGLLPHLNPGVMPAETMRAMRPVAASMGLMLETAAERLAEPGGPHHGSPDKLPATRLAMIEEAGRAGIPFTTGILIGIGETRRERIEALLALRDSDDRHGHLQEIIIQNFRAKPRTRMAHAAEPPLEEQVWTVAVARILFGQEMNVQAPPNLRADGLLPLLAAGINDWGGVSPVTIDHVNPEAPWPEIADLEAATARAGKVLVERLTIYPSYAAAPSRWIDPALQRRVLDLVDADGFARPSAWAPGETGAIERLGGAPVRQVTTPRRRQLDAVLARAAMGNRLDEADVVSLFAARGEDARHVCAEADALRRRTVGDAVTYVVTRNINYTNVCTYRCQFCAFSKGRMSENLRGRPYDLDLAEIQRRVAEAWARGATEVCLQGGIHPAYTGTTYLAILRAVKEAAPGIHVHAFSSLEVFQGAATLGLPPRRFLERLQREGLGSLPGTAAEILDDAVRAIICPDKIDTAQWLAVMRDAHEIGLRSTATIMFGHVDRPVHWARHLLRLRDLQEATGGFTEFVPLPFVPMETPIYIKGRARRGASFREAVLMHAVARLMLHPLFRNIQTSWVKMGQDGAAECLRAGANDLGGTLMNETISRAAGAEHGQEMSPARLTAIAGALGRPAWQRSTLYAPVSAERHASALAAGAMAELRLPPARGSRANIKADAASVVADT